MLYCSKSKNKVPLVNLFKGKNNVGMRSYIVENAKNRYGQDMAGVL